MTSLFASQTQVDDRLSACNSCDKKITKMYGGMCNVCGCVIKLKAALSNSTCPLGKWGPPANLCTSSADYELGGYNRRNRTDVTPTTPPAESTNP
jgi:hypothetical protein